MCPRSHRQLWTLGEDCLYAKVEKDFFFLRKKKLISIYSDGIFI